MIKILLLKTGVLLITKIEEEPSELGEPDCKMTKPYIITDTGMMPWMSLFTAQDEMMIHSDSILTIVSPTEEYLDKYQSLISK
jgi:hypothetical protein